MPHNPELFRCWHCGSDLNAERRCPFHGILSGNWERVNAAGATWEDRWRWRNGCTCVTCVTTISDGVAKHVDRFIRKQGLGVS